MPTNSEILIDLIGIEAATELPRLQDAFSHVEMGRPFLSYIIADTQRLREALGRYVGDLFQGSHDLILWDKPDHFRDEFASDADRCLSILMIPDDAEKSWERYAYALQMSRDWLTKRNYKVLLLLSSEDCRKIKSKAGDYFSVNVFFADFRDQKALYDMPMPPLADKPYEDPEVLREFEEAGERYDQAIDEDLPAELMRKAWLRFIEAAKKLGRWNEVRIEAEQLQDEASQDGDEEMAQQALLLLCEGEYYGKNLDKAQELVERLKAMPDLQPSEELRWRFVEANILYDRFQPKEALAAFQQVGPMARALQEESILACTLKEEGGLLLGFGKMEEAMANLKEAERIFRQLGERRGLAAALGNQAMILGDWGRLEEAMMLHKEQERLSRETGNHAELARALGNQALILKRWGRLEEAMTVLKEGEKLNRYWGNKAGLANCLGIQAAILRTWGQLEEAMALHQEVEKIERELGHKPGIARCLGNQAIILSDWGRLAEAMALYKEQEKLDLELDNKSGLANCLNNQAAILLRQDRLEEAMALYKEVEMLCRDLGNKIGLAYSLGNQAAILEKWKRLGEAIALLQQALPLAKQIYPKLESSLTRHLHKLIDLKYQSDAFKP